MTPFGIKDEVQHESPAHLRGLRIQWKTPQNPQRDIPGSHGRVATMVDDAGGHRPRLPQGRERESSLPTRYHAAHSLQQ